MADIEIERGVTEAKDPKTEILVMRSLQRNTTATLVDSGGFGAALGFIGYSTVLPTMALALSKSEPYVGLLTTIWSGMWLLPQLPAGCWMAHRHYKKPVLVTVSFFSRIPNGGRWPGVRALTRTGQLAHHPAVLRFNYTALAGEPD